MLENIFQPLANGGVPALEQNAAAKSPPLSMMTAAATHSFRNNVKKKLQRHKYFASALESFFTARGEGKGKKKKFSSHL